MERSRAGRRDARRARLRLLPAQQAGRVGGVPPAGHAVRACPDAAGDVARSGQQGYSRLMSAAQRTPAGDPARGRLSAGVVRRVVRRGRASSYDVVLGHRGEPIPTDARRVRRAGRPRRRDGRATTTPSTPGSRRPRRSSATVVDDGQRFLGICLGHQLAAAALGGEVIVNPHGQASRPDAGRRSTPSRPRPTRCSKVVAARASSRPVERDVVVAAARGAVALARRPTAPCRRRGSRRARGACSSTRRRRRAVFASGSAAPGRRGAPGGSRRPLDRDRRRRGRAARGLATACRSGSPRSSSAAAQPGVVTARAGERRDAGHGWRGSASPTSTRRPQRLGRRSAVADDGLCSRRSRGAPTPTWRCARWPGCSRPPATPRTELRRR